MNSSFKDKSSKNLTNDIRQLQAQIRDFEELNRALENIWSATRVEDTIRSIIESSLQLCNADQGSILLLDPEEGTQAKTLVRQGKAQKTMLDQYLNHLLAGWVSQNQRPLLTQDLVSIFGKDNIKLKYDSITSVLSVPIALKSKAIGVINLINQDEVQQFSQREQQLMSLLAAQCAHFIRNARLQEQLFTETTRLKMEVQERYTRHDIIGHSEKMQAVFSLLDRVIPTDARVMLEGESGTGKERIARAIHYSGPRKDAPFIAIDCGALPVNLLESELFGYTKGAFTGADSDHKGLFEEANGGTLFLDEIGNMPPEVQSKLLRVIQEGEVRPLGSSQVKKVDVRIISAASGNLQQKIEESQFRQDLYYRLNVINITLPPLRERKEDIAILASYFLQNLNESYRKKIRGFDKKALSLLETYSWPGNVRELEHAVERAVVLCQSNRLSPADFSQLEYSSPQIDTLFQPRQLQTAVKEFKAEFLTRILQQTGGSQKEAAALLGIQRSYLNRLIRELKLTK
jgi:Nif-specific regulatory protein